jgi:pyroglutamyl-peptidase
MSDAPIVLVTGFEPFGGETLNPSREIALALDGTTIASHPVVGALLPVTFADSVLALETLLARHRPALALAIGQAGGRAELALERVAINLIDARIPDNAGAQPIDEAVIPGAPTAYFSRLPLRAMRARMIGAGAPTAISLTAGSFVCNHVFFALSHLLATRHAGMRGGFIHVPWLPVQAARHGGEPSLPLETMLHGVRAAVECALSASTDLDESGGATH